MKASRRIKTTEKLSLLMEAERVSASSHNLDEMAREVLRVLSKVSGGNFISLHFLNEEEQKMELISFLDVKRGHTIKRKGKLCEMSERIAAIAHQRKKVFYGRGKGELRRFPFIEKEGITTLASIPLSIKGKVKGVVTIYWKGPRRIKPDEMDLIVAIASQAVMGIENIRARRSIKVLANLTNIDGLTQLYNHKYFHENLERELSLARRFNYPLCLCLLDIDHFKRYNDAYGHPEGDVVLKQIAKLVMESKRRYDVAARYGGEELALILPHTTNQKALPLMERIRECVAEHPFPKGRLTISIGLASFPHNATSKSQLIEKADQALYLAKEEGRNRVCFSLAILKTSIRLGFCPPALRSQFYIRILEGVREVIQDMGRVELTVRSPKSERSYKEQMRIIDEFIHEGLDAIAIYSKARREVSLKIKEANRRGIPVFVFNTLERMPAGRVTSYIGYDNIEAGRKVGRYLVRLLREAGRVTILEGIPAEDSSRNRKKGFLQTIRRHPGVEIVSSRPAYWERKKAKEVSRKLLKSYPDLGAIFALSDEMALGATDVIREMRRTGKIFIIGIDGNLNALESIKEGNLTATLNTDPLGMGKVLMRSVVRSMIKEEKIPPFIPSPINMVDLENVDQYL